MITLPKPKSNIQDVLITLINNGEASLKDFGHLQGLRTRFSELRLKYGLLLGVKKVKGFNRRNHPMTYNVHTLPKSEKDKAIEIYLKMCENQIYCCIFAEVY